MALNQAQWYAKISKFVPSWYFERKTTPNALTPAAFQAIAAYFAQIQQDTDDAQSSTFILDSPAPVIDLIGDERNIDRNPGELTPAYQVRVQNGLFVPVGKVQLAIAVNALLNNGPAFFIENRQYGFYDDPDTSETPGFPYCDDQYSINIISQKWYNWWTLLIPTQDAGDLTSIFAAVVAAIEANKALGTTYDIIYAQPEYLLDEDGGYILDEDGGRIELES